MTAAQLGDNLPRGGGGEGGEVSFYIDVIKLTTVGGIMGMSCNDIINLRRQPACEGEGRGIQGMFYNDVINLTSNQYIRWQGELGVCLIMM